MDLSRALAATFALAALLPACKSGDSEAPMPIVDDRLIVGCDLENPPFASGSPDAPVGRDVEMMKLVGARMKLPIEWRKIAFSDLLPAVESGEVDLVCATLGITPEREARVLFTRPYFETEIAVVVRAGADEPATFAALAGKRVGASPGTTSERAVRRLLSRALCVPSSKTGSTTEEMLLAGELDACAMDAPNADRMVAASGGRLALMDKPLESEHYAIAVSKQRPTLCKRLDIVLAEMERGGTLLALDETYGL